MAGFKKHNSTEFIDELEGLRGRIIKKIRARLHELANNGIFPGENEDGADYWPVAQFAIDYYLAQPASRRPRSKEACGFSAKYNRTSKTFNKNTLSLVLMDGTLIQIEGSADCEVTTNDLAFAYQQLIEEYFPFKK